ncbi:hypothetical protein E2C01_079342 [Portunus trituberculatus]|uniref:Uncharacterized protein n=1 Tax=Portunus trituberculatus TaxID=210409 RepID=A0A5B7IR65_PORTR|nr:hypothetical protein [Portunus trituberculatus]
MVDVTKGLDAATHMPERSHLAGGAGPRPCDHLLGTSSAAGSLRRGSTGPQSRAKAATGPVPPQGVQAGEGWGRNVPERETFSRCTYDTADSEEPDAREIPLSSTSSSDGV